ncbi:hypothetical protein Q8F55_003215 [Vanrija albida]|uniref:MARVEL domain-containing protein n=1 Tax=Vanrija albida TaxID=181172 RepID=A0ABR3QBV5_9TREE
MRGAIHVQTGLCASLLTLAALALALMGYTFATTKSEYDRAHTPYVYTVTSTLRAQGYDGGGAPARTRTMTLTVAPVLRAEARPTATIPASLPMSPGPTAPPAAPQWEPEPHPPLSDASIGAAVALGWLSPLVLYLAAFLVTRARAPASPLVAVLADLCLLGTFWLLGTAAMATSTAFLVLDDMRTPATSYAALVASWAAWALTAAWGIWELVYVSRRFRGGWRRSLVQLVQWGYEMPGACELRDMAPARKLSLDR